MDTGGVYYLTNAWAGSKRLASASGNAPVMAEPNSGMDQQWYLKNTQLQGYYYLHTKAKGDEEALDVLNGNGTESINIQFYATGFFAGQFWRIDPWGDGTYRISNNFTGLDKHIDTYSNTLQPYLAAGDFAGQHWRFETLKNVLPDSSSPTDTKSWFSSSSSDSSATAVVTSKPAVAQKGGLSTGGIIGAVIGSVAVVSLIIGALVLWWTRRKNNVPPEARSISTISYNKPMGSSPPEMLYKFAPSPEIAELQSEHLVELDSNRDFEIRSNSSRS